MTFRELQETIERLASDPRVHPNTRVAVQLELDTDDGDVVLSTQPLCHIALNGSLLLAATRAEPAMAR